MHCSVIVLVLYNFLGSCVSHKCKVCPPVGIEGAPRPPDPPLGGGVSCGHGTGAGEEGRRDTHRRSQYLVWTTQVNQHVC